MSYIGMRKSYTSGSTFYNDVCSIAVLVGWEQVDSVTVNANEEYKVFKSSGESGNYAPVYVRVYRYYNDIRISIYLYWNSSTHVGTVTTYSINYGSCTYGTNAFIAASKDLILVTTAASKGNRCGAGFIPNPAYTVLTKTTSSITAGSSVNIPVISSSGFKVGNKYQIIGQDSTSPEGRYQLTVESIPDSTSIVVTSLPVNFSSGAYFGQLPCPAGIFGSDVGYGDVITRMRPLNRITLSSTTSENTDVYLDAVTPFYDTVGGWPDLVADEYILYPIMWHGSSATRIGNWGYSKQNFLLGYASATYLDTIGICSTAPEGGIASSGGTSTITDSSKSWTTDQWKDKWIILVNGTGSGQSRKILSNTDTVITVVTSWDTPPGASSTVYRIVDESYRNIGSGLFALETQNSLS